jgi:DNA processing protein
MTEKEIISTLALTRINYFQLAGLRLLYDTVGSATVIVENYADVRDIIPDASPRLLEALRDIPVVMQRAEEEYNYSQQHGIQILTLNDGLYPRRLRECDDAPLLLFYKGTADLNQQRVINIVGTRHVTVYGQDLVRHFIQELKQLCPQVLIVSGLAYGVDICAHRNALQQGYETVGVLAHGLDDLYPPRHRETASQMVRQGGLLTEHFTKTNADKLNFVRRNRIVAGMSDAAIIVESAAKGGSLITARLSRDYNRDTFAFPGPVGAPYSEGCNRLIRDHQAMLITSAEDFVTAMGWQDDAALSSARQQGIERQLFPQLNETETLIVNALSRNNDQQINMLAVGTNLSVGTLTAVLFELELKGVVKTLAGGIYHLLG